MLDDPAAPQVAAPHSAECAQPPCVTGISPVALFAIAASYEAAGRLDEAESLLRALTADPEIEYRTEARFRLGKLRERRGDRTGAIAAYRALLDEKPNATRVRLDLARLLAFEGDESGARRELRMAGTGTLPEEVARAVDQFATALRSRKPFGATAEVAIAPDSNINASTSQRTIETIVNDLPLSRDARATSGVGLALSGQAYARVKLVGQSVLTRLSARADLYDAGKFNDISVSLASGPELRIGRMQLRPAVLVGRRWFGSERYSTSVGGTVNLSRPVGRKAQIEADLTALRSSFRLYAQDGMAYDGSVAIDRAFSPRLSIRLGARISRQDARDPGYATTARTLDALVARRWGRQTVFAQLSYTAVSADARLFLFPERRRDRRWDATIGFVARGLQICGLSPLVRIMRSQSTSTVGLYEFRRTRVEFALSRDF